MALSQTLQDEVTRMPPHEKLALVDAILASLDTPDRSIDQLWEQEAEDRIRAFDQKEISSVSTQTVFAKYAK